MIGYGAQSLFDTGHWTQILDNKQTCQHKYLITNIHVSNMLSFFWRPTPHVTSRGPHVLSVGWVGPNSIYRMQTAFNLESMFLHKNTLCKLASGWVGTKSIYWEQMQTAGDWGSVHRVEGHPCIQPAHLSTLCCKLQNIGDECKQLGERTQSGGSSQHSLCNDQPEATLVLLHYLFKLVSSILQTLIYWGRL